MHFTLAQNQMQPNSVVGDIYSISGISESEAHFALLIFVIAPIFLS